MHRSRKTWCNFAILCIAGGMLLALFGGNFGLGRSPVAHALDNGLAQKPFLGWSSWSLSATSYSGYGQPWLNANHIKEQSDAMHQKLQSHGYTYINIDSYWAQDPTQVVDSYGRWAVDTTRFPNGIADVASYVHNNGQKIGIYLNPGIAKAAVNQNKPIEGTSCHAQDIAVQPLTNGNVFGDTYQIDFSKSCAQDYIKSEVNLLTSWGVDFLKLDAVSPGSGSYDDSINNKPEVQAWSSALTGKNIWFALSWSLRYSDASFWKQYANSWRIDNDVECYCGTLVTWDNSVKSRFNDGPPWVNYVGPGGWGDYDSLDVGNGAMDGISQDERQSYATLWAISAAPLYTGDDMTKLDSFGTSLLTNDEVIAVNQAGRVLTPLSQSSNQQVWRVSNGDGSYTVALFNLGGSSATVTAKWSDLGFSGSAQVRDLWSHSDLGTFNDQFSASLNTHASRLLKVTPTSVSSYEAESGSNTLSGAARVQGCGACSGGQNVGYIGNNNGTLQFNNVDGHGGGTRTLTIYYVSGENRSTTIRVNGGSAINVSFPSLGSWGPVGSVSVNVSLNSGNNTILFSGSSWAPDIDRISV